MNPTFSEEERLPIGEPKPGALDWARKHFEQAGAIKTYLQEEYILVEEDKVEKLPGPARVTKLIPLRNFAALFEEPIMAETISAKDLLAYSKAEGYGLEGSLQLLKQNGILE